MLHQVEVEEGPEEDPRSLAPTYQELEVAVEVKAPQGDMTHPAQTAEMATTEDSELGAAAVAVAVAQQWL